MSELKRYSPRQARARETVSLFYEATAQLLERSGGEALTTNRVAERAGFSIGTLYRYFSGKMALFRSMAFHEMDRREAGIMRALEEAGPASAEDIVRIFVRHALHPFEGRREVRRTLLKAAIRTPGMGERYERMLDRLSAAMVGAVAARAVEPVRKPTAEEAFAAVRGIIGAIRADVLFGGDRIGRPEFEDALVRIAVSIFRH